MNTNPPTNALRAAVDRALRISERDPNYELTTDPYADGWNECRETFRDALSHAEDPADPSSPPDQTLRDRIAEALLDYLSRTADIRPGRDGALAFMPEVTDEERMRIADALAAVLPPPAARSAVLREAAEDLATAFGDPMVKHIGAVAASHLRRRARELEGGEAGEEQPETPLEKRFRYSERRNDELRAECKRRGKTVLEYAEKIQRLEKQLDEVRTQLGAEILRAGQAEATLERIREVVRRLANHAVGFQDVLDDSDRDPWAKSVGADIDELRRLAAEAPQPEAPWATDSARIGRVLIWSHAQVGRSDFGQGYRTAQEDVRAILTRPLLGSEAPQPECTASRSGSCLREAESETACDTDAGECVHGGRPGVEAAQPDTETQPAERPRCPHCQLPHDLDPASGAPAACASILASLADTDRRHAEGDHGGCARVNCDVVRERATIVEPRHTCHDQKSAPGHDWECQWCSTLPDIGPAAPAAAGPGRAADTRSDEEACDGCGHPKHPANKCRVVLYGEQCACDEPIAAKEA